jgi:hypothetical protein
MVAINQQIVECYETLDMSVSEIAADQSIDETVVKSVLLQCSQKYREETKLAIRSGHTDEDVERAFQIIRNTAFYSEDEHLAFRAAESIIDEKKGRKDAVLKLAKNSRPINAYIFNVQFQKAAEAIKRAQHKVIDVCSVNETSSPNGNGVPA